MKNIKTVKANDKSIWVIAHDNKEIYHFLEVEPGSEFSTPLTYVEQFETEEEMATKINQYKKDPTFYEEYLKELDA
jgi:hypothetical protein